jgi:hypothetical protein
MAFREKPETSDITQSVEILDFRQRWVMQFFREML